MVHLQDIMLSAEDIMQYVEHSRYYFWGCGVLKINMQTATWRYYVICRAIKIS